MSLKTIIEENEKMFDDLIGEVPEIAIMEKYGKEFCVMCGHPTKADKVVKELKNALRSSQLRLLDGVREMVEETDIDKAHTYASENADVYRAYDAGQENFKKKILTELNIK